MKFTEELLATMYYRMNQARFFEETLKSISASDKINGVSHLSIGQEASAVGACMAIEKGDDIVMSFRSHAQAIASGVEIKGMMAEALGKASGIDGGLAGSAHLSDLSVHNLGTSPAPGANYPVACGAALTHKQKEDGHVVLCFGGDGTLDEGAFYESLNLAALWKLPVIFMIENNFFSGATAIEDHLAPQDIKEVIEGYGVPAVTVDGNDAVAVAMAVEKARAHAAAGEGPFFIEAQTYRLCGYDTSDLQLYRSVDEQKIWQQHDPIALFAKSLVDDYGMKQNVLDQLKQNASRSVSDALSYAEASDDPAMNDALSPVLA
ncbi:MAG: thiamine pyrophosphate-dependent dehydrogenase E1 component subunit alpha [Eubacteriaceae bacterium]|jgi:TPP-dependent pyruvate/acetoin dehydrogenase alpha subunit|uniref:Thiamine pyrophosphate-dependent dehydrogenase E1 component subunit alpha n=1 Tax=Candidatus Pseudoramibacter fermentans TaxID=2594427 RepID=A0A6L5GRF4_9FIRM|nr:thiamine pyrophosphate-dependent dehydrogenase E1 component subunit alpha [Candidatus Pseudoramibacter fermentans]RRF92845.1 MAG: thiamine pyrophosphate-dependent dehydrogenase E1 component subunit alpha [Eubacteriaceae bacterium]